MAGERIATLTTTTGATYKVAQERMPARSFGSRFMVLFDEELEKLTAEITNGTTLRVLLRLPRHLDFEAFRRLDQKKLARELRMAQASVSNAMAELLRRKLVEKQGAGPVTEWRLSLEWGWRGTVDSYHAARGRRGKPAPPPRGPASIAAEEILWKLVPMTPGRVGVAVPPHRS